MTITFLLSQQCQQFLGVQGGSSLLLRESFHAVQVGAQLSEKLAQVRENT